MPRFPLALRMLIFSPLEEGNGKREEDSRDYEDYFDVEQSLREVGVDHDLVESIDHVE